MRARPFEPRDASRRARRAALPLVLAAVGQALCPGCSRGTAADPPVPRRALHELRGWGSGVQALRDRVHEAIEGAGLEAVPDATSGPGGSLDGSGLARLARQNGAAQGALLQVEALEERPGLGSGAFVLARVSARTAAADDGEPARPESSVVLASEAVDRVEAGRAEPVFRLTAPCPGELARTSGPGLLAVARASAGSDPAARDHELVLLDPSTGLVTALTANAADEGSPRAARDAPRVAFARAHGSPFFEGLPERAVFAADLP